MKKILLSVLSLAAIMPLAGRTLTPDEALQRVFDSSNVSSPVKMPSQSGGTAPVLRHTAFTSSGAPAVYLFDRAANGAGGYMLVSADDVACPLLGYSDAPVEPDTALPEQMQWWLGQYAAEIEMAGESYARPLGSRAAGSTALGPSIAPLCTTLWDQSTPYNNLCPTVSGKRAMTGCMATAMAQVLKYHNWPEKGEGRVDYTDSYGTQRSLSLASTYDWTRMLDTYTGTTTAAQKNAVALLMRNCGYAVRMTYSSEASGASDIYVVPALVENFGYDKGARLCQRNNYGLAEWEEMIYENLAEAGPVLYCGSSFLGGHAFVCDGYSTDGYFHFNWGWSGNYDGYFRLTALNPEGQGIGGFAGGYNLSQSVVLGIRKPTGTEYKSDVRLEQAGGIEGYVSNGILTLSGTWINYTGFTMNFELGLKAVPVDGTGGDIRYIPTPYGTLQLPNGSAYNELEYYVNTLPEGTWRVSAVTRRPGETDSDWQETLHPINHPNFVTLKCNSAGYSVENPAVANLKVTSAEVISGLYNGCMTKIRFTVTNPNDVEVMQVIEPILANGSQVVAEAGGKCVDLMPGETETVELTFTFTYFEGFKINTNYDFCLFDPYSDRELYNFGTSQVKAYPGTPTLVAGKFSVDGGTTAVDPSDITFNATVKCSKGYMANVLEVLVTPQGGGDVLAMANSADVLFLEEGEIASTSFKMNFTTAEPGATYTAFLCFEDILGRQQLKWLDFTIGTSGITAVDAEADGIGIVYDRVSGCVRVMSAAGGLQVSVIDVAGRHIGVLSENDAARNEVDVDLSACAPGVAVVAARDAAGNARTVKVVL